MTEATWLGKAWGIGPTARILSRKFWALLTRGEYIDEHTSILRPAITAQIPQNCAAPPFKYIDSRWKSAVTFTTPDPLKFPLPSRAYFELHSACCRVSNLSGLTNTLTRFWEKWRISKCCPRMALLQRRFSMCSGPWVSPLRKSKRTQQWTSIGSGKWFSV